MAIGGYTSAVLSRDHHTNLIVTMLIAFGICFVAGLLFGLPALRLSGVYLALATFALAISIQYLPLQWSTYLGGTSGVVSPTTNGNVWIYGVAWATAAVLFVLAWLIVRGRVGRAFRAVRDSEIAAIASGVEIGIYKTLAFAISAAFCGAAGALYFMWLGGVGPQDFGVDLSLSLLVGAAVAGLGSLWGVLVGAIFIGLLPTISSSAPVIGNEHGRGVVYGVFVIVVMLVAPNGFAGVLRQIPSLRQGLNRESKPVKLHESSS
jgi:branched-chain amino acid transport system permease protein